MENLSFYDLTLSLTDKEQCEEGARSIVRRLRPQWTIENIHFEVFTAGITNKIFCVWESDDEDRLIFRVFGKNTEKIIDRTAELTSWIKLASKGLAAPLYGTFENGIVCGYINGVTTTVVTVKEPKIRTEIARSMATMHSLPCDSTPVLFSKIKNFIRNFDRNLFNDEQKKIFDDSIKFDLSTRLDDLKSKIENGPEHDVGFCHNDILVHNILYDERKNKINFIDYEYASSNYVLFDIANHFCEYAGVEDPDYSRCPKTEEASSFLAEYLKFAGIFSESKLAVYTQQLPLFEAASHLFWATWALVQAQNSTIEFDYLGYAVLRFGMYNQKLNEYETGKH